MSTKKDLPQASIKFGKNMFSKFKLIVFDEARKYHKNWTYQA